MVLRACGVQRRPRQREQGDSPVRRENQLLGNRPFLPRETRNYVPNFIAVVYLMEHHADHGIFPQNTLPSGLSVDTLMVQGPLRFDQMAAVTSLTESEVAALNPMYRLGIVPGPDEHFQSVGRWKGWPNFWPKRRPCACTNRN